MDVTTDGDGAGQHQSTLRISRARATDAWQQKAITFPYTGDALVIKPDKRSWLIASAPGAVRADERSTSYLRRRALIWPSRAAADAAAANFTTTSTPSPHAWPARSTRRQRSGTTWTVTADALR
jgi:hypothetical protein